MEITEQVRPVYRRESERDPMALLTLHRGTVTEEQVIAEARKAAGAENPEVKALEGKLGAMQATLAYLVGQRTGEAQAMPDELVELLTGGVALEPEPEKSKKKDSGA